LHINGMFCEAKRAFPPTCKQNLNNPLGICGIWDIRLQVHGFPCARPRMCRLEVWVAALSLIEAHSHTLVTAVTVFRRIKL
jgi:hypothetical protein